jgi:phosphoethanolamine N-methyltransferase
MAHADEYHDAMVALLELIWGDGFMAPGGPGNVRRMVEGIPLRGRRLLDVGCGIGGPALQLAEEEGARVLGIDLEAPLIERARQRAKQRGLEDRVEFRVVSPGALPCDDASLDVVLSAGALTQIEDKLGMLEECLRVLRPGGWVTCYDWMKSDGEYSADMRHWFEMEGLSYAMETLEGHRRLFERAGFVEIETTDASDWYRRKAREEYEQLKGPLDTRMRELIGDAQADHFVENWRAMVVVCEKGEMRQGYSRARKPPSDSASSVG